MYCLKLYITFLSLSVCLCIEHRRNRRQQTYAPQVNPLQKVNRGQQVGNLPPSVGPPQPAPKDLHKQPGIIYAQRLLSQGLNNPDKVLPDSKYIDGVAPVKNVPNQGLNNRDKVLPDSKYKDGVAPVKNVPNQPVYKEHKSPQRHVRGKQRDRHQVRDEKAKYEPTPEKVTPLPADKLPYPKLGIYWSASGNDYNLKAFSSHPFRIRMRPYPSVGSPWPMPQSYETSKQECYPIIPDQFLIQSDMASCDILEDAITRYQSSIFKTMSYVRNPLDTSCSYSNGTLNPQVFSLNISVVKVCEGFPSLDMDESYELQVDRKGASLIAMEIWGALRGIETFSQLIYRTSETTYQLNKTTIRDHPRFLHRGILVDTARHFLSLDTIKTTLEIMAQNKFNVLHWHMTDDQSFPFQLKSFPNITKKGSFDPDSMVYTHDDVTEVVKFARMRGIRVIPEFDTPGHTFSWGLGKLELLTPCYKYSQNSEKVPDGMYGPLHPALNSTYDTLTKIFQEVLDVFPDKYVHLGGDEVPFDCWRTNPYIAEFMKQKNLRDIREMLQYYEQRLVDIVASLGKDRPKGAGTIVWQEVVDNNVKMPPNTIIEVWKSGGHEVFNYIQRNISVIYSSCWYLDHIKYGLDWHKFYNCDGLYQLQQLGRDKKWDSSKLLGGEVCLWAEYVDDNEYNQRLWPRASAAAERLWSHHSITDVHRAAPRIEEHRCRMISRGLPMGVINGPGYCKQFKSKPKALPSNSTDENTGLFSSLSLSFNDITSSINIPETYSMMYLCAGILLILVFVMVICKQPSKAGILVLLIPLKSNTNNPRKLIPLFVVGILVYCLFSTPLWLEVLHKNSHSAPVSHLRPKYGALINQMNQSMYLKPP